MPHGTTFLFLALSRTGWGETSLGVEVARQIRAAGHTPEFVVHSGGVRALTGSGFQYQEIRDHALPLLQLLLEERIAEGDVAALVLADYQTANYTLTRAGVDPLFLLALGVPIIAMDTWDYDRTGSNIDTLRRQTWNIGNWIERISHRLVPVPIAGVESPHGYRGMPSVPRLPRAVRRHMRQNLGLGDDKRAILFCTAGWQHGIPDEDAVRVTAAVPRLLWKYIESLGDDVHLIHVGPTELTLPDAGDRYLWMPSVPPADFDRLLGAVDLLLSANISATTVTRAIAAGLPVVVIENSADVANADDVGSGTSHVVREWLTTAAPLYPFRLWPIGFHQFISPLLAANPYCDAVARVELLDDACFLRTCGSLLRDASARDGMRERQERYRDRVAQLPTAAERIHSYLA